MEYNCINRNGVCCRTGIRTRTRTWVRIRIRIRTRTRTRIRTRTPTRSFPGQGLKILLGESFRRRLFRTFPRTFLSQMDAGEDFLTPAPGAGQAGPKTRQNGGFGLAQKGPHNGAKMEPKMEPKWSQIWPQKGAQNRALLGGRKAPKPLECLVFWLKMTPRRGAIFQPKKWTKMEPKMEQK